MINRVAELLEESRRRGFLGPGPIEGHLDHARAFAVAWGDRPDPAAALDLGAGGGLPGLVLAVTHWPSTRWVFLDAQTKRTQFLQEAVEYLGLGDRVRVVTARAEDVGRQIDQRGTFDLVVARSFASPAVTAECAAPLLRAGGTLLVSEPPDAVLEDRWPSEALAVLGCGPARSVEIDGRPPAHFASIDQVMVCPDRYPRRVGIPAKRPLF